ncbi:two component system histidine kinase [Renibacterium salmoninarum ATCC 33209]|uniref:Two component system histidine kinase n=1 Tax=Renibacterium salmoninarum (strain ATCC 33209 / DSM 20767 / JCM 11484 / NBRC 15589 / NCIMB 2235) TaxID=288705 RepID=A9WLI9_RENSM|nr:two component system histidine kinase [Renibacterium salmoninarum ATCC 33209]
MPAELHSGNVDGAVIDVVLILFFLALQPTGSTGLADQLSHLADRRRRHRRCRCWRDSGPPASSTSKVVAARGSGSWQHRRSRTANVQGH